jgi:hypothetical protein
VDEPALAAVFARPAADEGDPELLWRERAFEVVLDRHWITGICDRVVIVSRPDGFARRAGSGTDEEHA